MDFKNILGYDAIKKYLKDSVQEFRIPHAQLFVSQEGCGALAMAIAYATYILSQHNEAAFVKCSHLSHPDMHFAFPTATNAKVKKDPISSLFLEEWRKFVKNQPYGNLFDWYQVLGIENKQGNIGVNEAKEITSKLALKSFEGGYKIMIIWMAEKMNVEASNKLLKLLEEPPQQTIFLLVSEDESSILDTIRSRCQILRFPPLSQNAIKEGLLARGVSESEATKLAVRAQGSFNKALSFLQEKDQESIFEEWFITWVRSAYRAKGNKDAILGLLQWSEKIAESGREVQKQFLTYCAEIFRQALLTNYKSDSLVYATFRNPSFELRRFAPFVHGNNIVPIFERIEDALFHIERNANAKMVFTDLSIKLTRLLHTKA